MLLAWICLLCGISGFLYWHTLEQQQLIQGWFGSYLQKAEVERREEFQAVVLQCQESNDLMQQKRPGQEENSLEISAPLENPKEKKPPPLHLFLVPYYARLNLIFLAKEPMEYQELFQRLICALYGHTRFYTPMRMEAFVKAFVEQLQLKPPEKTADLVTIDLHDELLQEFYYKMLTGCYGAADPKENYLSLLECVIYEPKRRKKKIDIHHALQPLLEAMLDDPRLAEAIVKERQQLYQEGLRLLRGKSDVWVSDLYLTEERVAKMMRTFNRDDEQWKMLFDFQVTKPKKDAIVHSSQLWRDWIGRIYSLD